MSFNFGGNPTPAPAPGAPAAGFSFGGGGGGASAAAPTGPTPAPSFGFGSTPAPAPQAGAPGASAPGGFSFGGAPSTTAPAAPTPAAPATGGFSFGGAPNTAPTPAPGGPAPATGGFSFGNNPAPAPNASAPTPGPAAPTPGAPAAGGFSFGNTPAPGAPAAATTTTPPPATGFSSSFGAGGTPAPATNSGPAPAPPTVTTQDFDTIYPNLQIWQQIQKFSTAQGDSDEGFLGKQDLHHCITTNQAKLHPLPAEWTPPNNGLRQQLTSNPTVSITNPDTGNTETTKLTSKNLERILRLASDLKISEANAVSLYAHVSRHLGAISSLSVPNYMAIVGMETKKYGDASLLARNFFFYQQGLQLQTLLFLLQSRFQNAPSVLEATDALLNSDLVGKLIKVIKAHTQQILQLQQEMGAKKNQFEASIQHLAQNLQQQHLQGTAAGGNGKKQLPTFASVHLLFCQQERQIASECLFFIAYHTQMTPIEMAGLLDLIKDLSDMLPTLSPFTNVPSPFEAAGDPAQNGWPSSSNVPFTYALKEKDPLKWQRELVELTNETGQTQVLQCISLLIVAAISAMEARQVLYDRDIHGPNSFGKGNKFLPPSENPSVPQDLQSRLGPDGANSWARKDIWGLLAAAYALMLRSAPSALMSPRAGSSAQTNQIRNTARDCLVLPSTYKSFTFCRLTMIPALQRLSLSAFANLSEFGLAVLSECVSHYLDVLSEGSMPMSRQKYEKEEKEELNLRRAQAAQQSQFNMWSGKTDAKQEEIPASVDLMARPDCLDDIVAVASTLCQLGGEYSQSFWIMDANGGLVPSRLLARLEQLQAADDSLMPTYLCFMAALVNDEASATAIYNFLARPPEAAGDGASSAPRINWISLIYNLRWYAQQLSNYDVTVSKSSTTSSSSSANTSYYYNLEGNSIPSGQSTSTSSTTQSKATTSGSGKPKELSSMATFRVASHLTIIQKVAQHSAAAQMAILSISIPIGDDVAAGGDDALLVLFKLAIAPLSPTVRGATLTTIANLLEISPGCTAEERAFALQQGTNAWEYLESCPLLPIALLDQHFNQQAADERARASIGFPPSSTTLSNSTPDKPGMLKKDPIFGILYEMEQIEARMGWYPSTEGFLQLLKSLIIAAGCPQNLGQSWRPRTGCAPYIEYILDFVLTRALGIKGAPILPFRVQGDQSRLLTRALEVLHVVISRYAVPSASLKSAQGKDPMDPMERVYAKAVQVLGIQAVADRTVAQDALASTESQQWKDDFTNRASTNFIENGGTATASAKSGLPGTKSPGFIVLADILASGGGTVFETLAMVLSRFGGTRSVQTVHRQQSDQIALAYALFGATPPTTDSAKEGAKERPGKLLQTYLKMLSPLADDTHFDDAAFWREKSMILGLQILCATATREEDFITAVGGAKEPLKIVPLLRFQQIRYASSNFRVLDVRLQRLTNLLLSIQGTQLVRSSIVDCVGYTGCSEEQDMDMGSSALSFLSYLLHSMVGKGDLGTLVGARQIVTLSRAVAKRLLNCAKRPGSVVDMQTTNLIFDWILRDLRGGMPGELVQALLGLPSYAKGGNWQPGTKQYSGSPTDCFDSMLELLKDIRYATAPETGSIASKCFEVFFRLYDLFQGAGSNALCLKTVLYTAERLRSTDFWTTSLLTWLSDRGVMPLKQSRSQVDATNLHSIAWLLKGLAIELKLLVGFANASILGSGLGSYLSPRPTQCRTYLSLLFGHDEKLILKLIQDIPLEKVVFDHSLVPPPSEELRKATYELRGPLDVVSGYQLVKRESVAKAITSNHSETEVESMMHWVDQWNAAASWDCGASHLSNSAYFALSAALESCQSLGTNGSVGEITGLHTTSQTHLLAMILNRLCVDENNPRGMDASLIPTASKNLSNAVLVLAESITTIDQLHAPPSSELLTAASMLSRTLAHSCVGDETGIEVPIRQERSTVLASALSAILRHTSKSEPDLVRQYQADFLAATAALRKMCLHRVDSDLGTVSMLARSAFGAIMDACSNDGAEQLNDSLVYHALPTPFLGSLLNLVATMDETICKLLQTIAFQPFGAEILLDAGILTVLQAAAKAYLEEEARVSSTMHSSSYNKISLATPRFLMSHLKLLSALMSSQRLPSRKTLELAIQAAETMALYKMTIRRLCYNFPVEADVLRCFMRGFVQALSISQSGDPSLQHSLLAEHSSKVKSIIAASGLVDTGIAMLCQQLWENPLPRDLLLQIPTPLKKSSVRPKSSVVNVETETERSWWDVLDTILLGKNMSTSQFTFNAPVGNSDFWGTKNDKKWNEDKFEYAIVAMDVLSLGTSLLKRLNRLDAIDSGSLACGLYHCAFAAQTLGIRMEEIQGLVSNPATMMDTGETRNVQLESEYLKLFGSSLSHSVEELVVLCHLLVGEVKENNKAAKSFSLVIDQIGIQSKGVGILESLSDGPSRLALVNQMCIEIKK
ncbi:unnamed protein product [Cylindrotheca closterium]|uniref:Nucleoporin n=1 Tax=Cylindrotheca closterium TaxID=2856 RepID=A0AAD2G9J3_9STRA|nr:unnamed protein product [Cylindrotheca closterium]